MSPDIRTFGATDDGTLVRAIRLAHRDLSAVILTRGAILHDVRLAGAPFPLTLGCGRLAAYEGPFAFAGAIVGPVSNRIGGASAVIDGRTVLFEAGPSGATLHGGADGTHAQVWRIEEATASEVLLASDLPDGLGGFPGRRRIEARYALTGDATLTLALTATTDAPTLMSLANHSYWNLDGRSDISGHTVAVDADRYMPTTAERMPTGEVRGVAGTSFDLRAGAKPMTPGLRLDTNYCLADAPRPLVRVATLTGQTGLRMTLETTEPGLQVYDGELNDSGNFPGHTGQPYRRWSGMALEPQRWPDAPNNPWAAQVALAPAETYAQTTRWSFALG